VIQRHFNSPHNYTETLLCEIRLRVKISRICFCNSDTLTLGLIAGASGGAREVSSWQRRRQMLYTLCAVEVSPEHRKTREPLKLNFMLDRECCWQYGQPLHSRVLKRSSPGVMRYSLAWFRNVQFVCPHSGVAEDSGPMTGSRRFEGTWRIQRSKHLIQALIMRVQPRWRARLILSLFISAPPKDGNGTGFQKDMVFILNTKSK
jgi:hypothetical protein